MVMRKFFILMAAVNCVLMMTNAHAMQGDGMERLNLALRDAVASGDTQAIKTLVESKAAVNYLSYDTFYEEMITPLIYATKAGHVGVVKELLAARAGINSKDYCTEYALAVACEKGHIEIVRELLADGIGPDCGRYVSSPLRIAVESNCVAVVKLLCAAKANVNEASIPYGCTALMSAVRRRNGEIVDELIRAGASVNKRDENGDAALHMAVEFGCRNPRTKDIVKMLILAGAWYDVENNKDQTAWDIATPELRLVMNQAEHIRKRLESEVVATGGEDVRSMVYAAAFANENEKKAGEALALEGTGATKDSGQEKAQEKNEQKEGEYMSIQEESKISRVRNHYCVMS